MYDSLYVHDIWCTYHGTGSFICTILVIVSPAGSYFELSGEAQTLCYDSQQLNGDASLHLDQIFHQKFCKMLYQLSGVTFMYFVSKNTHGSIPNTPTTKCFPHNSLWPSLQILQLKTCKLENKSMLLNLHHSSLLLFCVMLWL